MMRASAIAFGFVVGVLQGASAGGQRPPIPLRGTIFDSLRGQPIRDAYVLLAGRAKGTLTDSRGHFQFDSVQPGPQRIVAQHPVFDSIGLSGLSARASVTDGTNEVQLAVPSFATLWRAVCRGSAPQDSGIVYGTIRDARRGEPVADAAVEISWMDLSLVKGRVSERRWTIRTRSGEHGEYAACGVAPDLGLEAYAAADGRETGRVPFLPLATRIQRHDLVVGGDTETGIVTGIVADDAGQPVPDARVSVDSLPAVRARDDGTFLVSHVPTGTRPVKVEVVGAFPSIASVNVVPGATANVGVTVRLATKLAPVETRADRNARIFKTEFSERRRLGFGYARDSLEILRYDQFLNVLRDVPSMNVQYRTSVLRITVPDGKGGQCAPLVVIDGAEAEFGHLIDLEPGEVAALEVYTRAAHMPARFAPTGIQSQCGMILVWTKYGMRNR